MIIATTRLILILINRLTIGCKRIAKIVAKTRGIKILLAIYNANIKAIHPIKIMGIFTLIGTLIFVLGTVSIIYITNIYLLLLLSVTQ